MSTRTEGFAADIIWRLWANARTHRSNLVQRFRCVFLVYVDMCNSIHICTTMSSSSLALLVATPPKDLVKHQASTHQRLLVDILQSCAADGLCKTTFADDIDRLYTLFDVCCDNGLGCYVMDYVTMVCLDPSVTSNDPLESFMSDGACIVKWAERCVGDLRRKLLSTPHLCRLASAPAGAGGSSSSLLVALARLHTIAAALGMLWQNDQGVQDVVHLQQEATLLLQLCTVGMGIAVVWQTNSAWMPHKQQRLYASQK